MIQNEFALLERQDFIEIIQSQRRQSQQTVLKQKTKEGDSKIPIGLASSL